ncbi:MAG: hypothetical protein QOD10_5204 [Mycobacterium sp.]|nr:hypothetical protein [Mycobacterium sp.]
MCDRKVFGTLTCRGFCLHRHFVRDRTALSIEGRRARVDVNDDIQICEERSLALVAIGCGSGQPDRIGTAEIAAQGECLFSIDATVNGGDHFCLEVRPAQPFHLAAMFATNASARSADGKTATACVSERR